MMYQELYFLSCFAGPKDVKDIFSLVKDSAGEVSQINATLKHQACPYCLNYCLLMG